MKHISEWSLQIIAAIFTSFLVYAFGYLAWNGFVSDSEIWAITIAKNLLGEWHQPWVFSRVLFYVPLGLATAPFQTATSIFGAAKAVLFLNGLLILFFAFRLTRCLSSRQGIGVITPWIAVIFTLANTGFLNQGYRIRSDLFSCTLVLLALGITFRERGPLPTKKLLYWALPFLATPKAALHVLPAINIFDRKRVLLILFLGFFLTVLIFPEAITFFLQTYTHPEMGMGFFSWQRFVYLGRMVGHNGVFVLAFLLRFITLATRLRTGAFGSEPQRASHLGFARFIIGSVVVLTLSPEKVPFFVASFIPVFSVYASLMVDDILAILQRAVPEKRRNGYLPLLFASIIALLTAITVRAGMNWNAFRENNSSDIQMTLIRTLEAYLNRFPKATYYDVVGLVPQRATIRVFAGPNDPIANRNTYLTLEHIYKPDLIFMVRKIQYLQPSIGELIKKDYFSIGTNVYARWLRLAKPIPLPLKNRKELDPLLARLKNWAGAPALSEISVLVEAKGRPARTLQLRDDDLFNAKIVGANSRLTAASPFTKIDPITELLREIIRFDWDWTGAPDLTDDIPKDTLLPSPF